MKKLAEIAMPDFAHVPGRNARHREGFLDHVIALAPETTTDTNSQENIAWHFGLRLIAKGYYWEAHEVLEAVWARAAPNSLERALVRGVIQIANARLKMVMDRPKAAERLIRQARESFSAAFPEDRSNTLMGFELEFYESLTESI